MGGGGRREDKSDERVWQDSLSYATPVTQLLCKNDFSNKASHKKHSYMACWRGTGKQKHMSNEQFWPVLVLLGLEPAPPRKRAFLEFS